LSYWIERHKTRIWWSKHAAKILADPKATKSERECAAFRVQRFDIDLAKKLREKTRAR
jgi:hypothetical protein|tara:strand:- start:15 stop:188 length:174 start_codon:yes stop_codon:yes gene_type:complete